MYQNYPSVCYAASSPDKGSHVGRGLVSRRVGDVLTAVRHAASRRGRRPDVPKTPLRYALDIPKTPLRYAPTVRPHPQAKIVPIGNQTEEIL